MKFTMTKKKHQQKTTQNMIAYIKNKKQKHIMKRKENAHVHVHVHKCVLSLKDEDSLQNLFRKN